MLQRLFLRRRLASLASSCAALLLAPVLLAQQDATDTIQPWQVATARSVTAAELSPTGDRLAYLQSVPRRPLADDSGPAWHELHVIDGASASRPFITGKVDISAIQWTPDGDRISFLAKRAGDDHKSLYAIAAAGGEARRLFQHDTDIAAYSWHPNGRRVAFLADDKVNEEREKLEKKGFDQKIYEEDVPFTRLYSVDLVDAVDAADTVGAVDAEAKKPEARRLEVTGSLHSVRYAADGNRLVISVTPTPLVDDSYVRIKVKILDGDGKELAAIDNPGKLGDALPSPDGRVLALISAADLNDPAPGRLMVAPMGGGPLRDVLPDFQGHVSSVAWRDADTLVYVGALGAETVVGSVRRDGTQKRDIVAAGQAIFDSIALSARGRAAVLADRPQHPAELYDLDLASGRLKRLTDSNPWLDNLRLARQEVVGFRARDGLELEGILIYPRDYVAGQRYPLIVIVHGGPESHFSNGWLTGYSQLGQLAAARGFAVFYPNYRGSTGRGVEFSKLSQAAATAEEFTDLVDGVDHLIAIGLANRDRVGITGGSYGGYASAWATTYASDRFAAAIPFVGISDAISKVGTTDIPREMYEVHHRKWLWEDWEYFAKASPIYYAQRNRTPTLILHGEDDPRVHPSQSLELYRHLKVLGQAPVRLVFYPGEGHGNRKSAGRFDYLLRTLRWMEHYLVGPGGEPPPQDIDYAAELPWPAEEPKS